jgi:hypothetical protein
MLYIGIQLVFLCLLQYDAEAFRLRALNSGLLLLQGRKTELYDSLETNDAERAFKYDPKKIRNFSIIAHIGIHSLFKNTTVYCSCNVVPDYILRPWQKHSG